MDMKKYPAKVSFGKVYWYAMEESVKYPNQVYTIMDKPNKQCIVHTVEWIVDQRILDGWHIVCRIQNGKVL